MMMMMMMTMMMGVVSADWCLVMVVIVYENDEFIECS